MSEIATAKTWEATLTIGGFVKTFHLPDLLPEVQILAPTELLAEYRLQARKEELDTLDIPKRWRFRLKGHDNELRRCWYDFYSQE